MSVESLQQYVKNGLLRVVESKEGYELVCYTKKCFFGDNTWDDVTKSHRGQLYYKGKKVNHPFKKIFNVDEVPETKNELICERMKSEPYDVYDKANGHLFIVSIFTDKDGNQHTVFSTKGSLPNPENDLLNNDIVVFDNLYGAKFEEFKIKHQNMTLMFEAIVKHDKHSMYDIQVEQYGYENCFVLLGVSILNGSEWVEVSYNEMNDIASFIGCPIVKKYDEIDGTPLMWKEHTDREGYVIRFLTNNDRVKIKTDEYWKNRFKKDLHPEQMLRIYAKGGRSLFLEKIPEELAIKCLDIIEEHFNDWYLNRLIRYEYEVLPFIRSNGYTLTKEKRKWLFTESVFTNYQKDFIVKTVDGKQIDIYQNKGLRQMFVERCIDSERLINRLKDQTNVI